MLDLERDNLALVRAGIGQHRRSPSPLRSRNGAARGCSPIKSRRRNLR
jgi:hypothetical protein